MSLYELPEVLRAIADSETEAEARRRISEIDARYRARMTRAAITGLLIGAAIALGVGILSRCV